MNERKVVLTEMLPKERRAWIPVQKHTNKRLLRNTVFFAAVSICLGACAWMTLRDSEQTETVMSHLTGGFKYDHTLGRLQLVSNILPESAMVFLSNDDPMDFCLPADAQVSHVWTVHEPWTEYAGASDISACQSGEIITVVANHHGEYTVRIIHENGYESIYSGLTSVTAKEYDLVSAGEQIGTCAENAAFELRKDGISVLPAFSEI